MKGIDAIILRRLYDRPSWAVSLRRCRLTVNRLIDEGKIVRARPPGSEKGGKSMVVITQIGIDAIEAHWRASK